MSVTDGFDRRVFTKGQIIVREGDDGRSAYLVQSGSVDVFREVNNTEVVLSNLGPGEIFGEMALLFNEPRSASVRCAQDCTLVVMDRDVFQTKLRKSDPTVRAMVRMLSRRVLSANESLIAEQRDLDSLVAATRVVFENVCADLPRIKKRLFEQGVRPRFEAFMSAVEALQDRFELDIDLDGDGIKAEDLPKGD